MAPVINQSPKAAVEEVDIQTARLDNSIPIATNTIEGIDINNTQNLSEETRPPTFQRTLQIIQEICHDFNERIDFIIVIAIKIFFSLISV